MEAFPAILSIILAPFYPVSRFTEAWIATQLVYEKNPVYFDECMKKCFFAFGRSIKAGNGTRILPIICINLKYCPTEHIVCDIILIASFILHIVIL